MPSATSSGSTEAAWIDAGIDRHVGGSERAVMQRCAGSAGDPFQVGGSCLAIGPPVLRNPVVESSMTTYRLGRGGPVQISDRGCLGCHFLGAQGSFIWLDATATRCR